MTIRVRDNGIGIPPHLLEKVFDLFAQGDRSLDRSQGGLGIGLSLVRGLVEMHGGTVSASSAGGGQGSRFTVRMPRSILVEAPVGPQPASLPEERRARRVLGPHRRLDQDRARHAHEIGRASCRERV